MRDATKVGATITAELTPSDATNVTSYQWYADNAAIESATAKSFKVGDAQLGKSLKVVVTDNEGNTFESPASAIVTESSEASVEIKLTDDNGLQTNGTGVVGDKLRVSYGADLGKPASITWYWNDTVVKAYTDQTGNLTNAITLDADEYNKKDGNYYVVIVNTDGKTFTSNVISLVYDEQLAQVSDFAISEDYETADGEHIALNTKSEYAVLKVTMNKAYEGTFYVYDNKVTSYTKTGAVKAIAFDPAEIDEEEGFKSVTTAAKLKEKAAIANPLVYTAQDGTTTLMFAISMGEDGENGALTTLTRGTSYKVAFDQKNVESDNIKDTGRTDITTTTSVAMPYVEAPASITMTSASAGGAAKVNVLNASGEKLAFLTDDDENTTIDGFASFVAYEGDSSSKSDMNKVAAIVTYAQKGVVTIGALSADNTYFYAKAKTEDGIFGEKAIELESGVKAANVDVAKKVEIEENADTPSQADIKLKGVNADATVYVASVKDLYEGGYTGVVVNDGEADEPVFGGINPSVFDKENAATYIKSARVTAGQGEVSISGVFKKDYLGGLAYADVNIAPAFLVYVVPDDEDTYSSIMLDDIEGGDLNGNPVFILEQTASSVKCDSGVVTVGGDAPTIAIEGLTAYDQFGSKMSTEVVAKTAQVTAIDKTGTIHEAGTAIYEVEANGNLTLTITDTTTEEEGCDKDDGYSVSFLGSTLTYVSKGNDNDPEIKLDGSKLTIAQP